MKTERVCVVGIVQGVGFRPFVSRVAMKYQLKGTVCNKGSYVEILIQGNEFAKKQFLKDLKDKAPARSSILQVKVETIDVSAYTCFSIVESERKEGDIFVSPDIATCLTCQKELFDPSNRRYLHPFINCTACGPRLTILEGMPYDRERTSMNDFPMCHECAAEYVDSHSRRYDAQPVCCPNCGPQVYILDRKEKNKDAIRAARRAICAGKIIAVKGLGGFHFCCDGTNEQAVSLLRKVKHRPVKPFAVMMKNLAVAMRECVVPLSVKETLDGHQKPIILLEKKENSKIAPSIAPDNPKVGVMLPYTPLHLLLFTYDDGLTMPDILVMTSANQSGAPICRTDEDIRTEVQGLCELVLSHDRHIRLRADDSVMDWYDDKPYMIRRSRGYAPLPFFLGKRKNKEVLAIGGELKNCFCMGKYNLYYLSPYIGDMSDTRTMTALKESVQRLTTLLEAKPQVVACDLHPNYNSRAVAETLDIPVISVQHHYAHVLSCMAENGYTDNVIGVSFDGTGYGGDGTIWGGEILLCDVHRFSRFAFISPFWHRGGDIASKEGWRIAVSILDSLYGQEKRKEIRDILWRLTKGDDNALNAQLFLADQGINSIISTSMGRIFDTVSAILGYCRISTFEGEGAMKLQFAAMRWERKHPLEAVKPLLPKVCQSQRILDVNSFITYLIRKIGEGVAAEQLAFEFHVYIARLVGGACLAARQETKLQTVVLTGGVFQNTLLLKLCEQILVEEGFLVLKHSLVPPNDGGLALGQAVYAMYHD